MFAHLTKVNFSQKTIGAQNKMIDNVVTLARCVPEMCVPYDHRLYKKNGHGLVYEYVCDSTPADYTTPEGQPSEYFAPTEGDHTEVLFCKGREIGHKFPMLETHLKHLFSFNPVRPAATYAVLFKLIHYDEDEEDYYECLECTEHNVQSRGVQQLLDSPAFSP